MVGVVVAGEPVLDPVPGVQAGVAPGQVDRRGRAAALRRAPRLIRLARAGTHRIALGHPGTVQAGHVR